MRIRYIPADPAGNLTGFVLTRVPAQERAALAARLMRLCPEGFEQIGYIDEATLGSSLPRMDMMGGEFCGNAARSFGMIAALRRGGGVSAMTVSVSGAAQPVPVELDMAAGRAYARMPVPHAVQWITAAGRRIPVVRMEGIAHAVLEDEAPSDALARAVLGAMPEEDAQGVIFARAGQMTPLVSVPAAGTSVWESSCGSGSVALAWLRAGRLPDGVYGFSFDEPGGRLDVRVSMSGGRAERIMMGGAVKIGEEREIEV